jgi:hypothetical protein
VPEFYAGPPRIPDLRLGGGEQDSTPGTQWFEEAHTDSSSGECHFLLVTIGGLVMTVRAIGESPGDTLVDIPRPTPRGDAVQGAIVVPPAPDGFRKL